jgi:hypothetical protein
MPKATSTVNGPIGAVPCAHCGRPQDCVVLEEQRAEEGLSREIPRGSKIECDDCGKLSEVVDVRKVVVVRQA